MGRQNNNIEHATTTRAKNIIRDMPQGVSDAIEAVRELNEAETEVIRKEPEPVSGELRDLVLFGRVVEDVKYGGYTIKISTLTNKQQKAVLTRLLKLTGDDRLMSVKAYTLAEAIISVNGVSLVDLYEGEQRVPEDEKKIDVVLNFQSSLVEKLFTKYDKMVGESNKIFDGGDLGEQIKN